MSAAARAMLWMPGELARLLVVDDEEIDRLSISASAFGSPEIQKFIVSAATSFGRSTCVEHVDLERGVDVAEQHVRGSR